ncbi:MAG: hypothetical protein JRJ08_06150 [Deltaproteobacteria bacterium]|nr:hypothetical protein [Deltaproteobacteria bacterium]
METVEPLFAEVALAIPVNKNLNYQIPPRLRESIEVGSGVLVPLGKRKVTGYVLALKTSSQVEGIKPIEEILDPLPLFDSSDLNFFKWIAAYYFCSLGGVIKNALPPGINIKTNKHLSLFPQGKEALSDQTLPQPEKQILLNLVGKRQVVLKSLMRSLKHEKFSPLISSLLQKGFSS